MQTFFKAILGLIALIMLAYIFPIVKEFYDAAAGNGTGMLYFSGNTTGYVPIGTPRNNTLVAFLPYIVPVAIFVAILLFVIVGRNEDQGGGQPR